MHEVSRASRKTETGVEEAQDVTAQSTKCYYMRDGTRVCV